MGNKSLQYVIIRDNCKIRLVEKPTNKIIVLKTIDYYNSNSISINNGLVIYEKDTNILSSNWISYWDSFYSECLIDHNATPDFVGVTVAKYCRLSDNKMVNVLFCKLEDGSLEIKDTDSNVSLTEADLSSQYEAECPELVCVCSESHHTMEEGQTIDYSGLLALFNSVSTFDDGTTGATGINFVKFGSFGLLSFNYNGSVKNDVQGSFSFGGEGYNDISNDLSITSVKGSTTITFTAYKCN